MTYDELTRDQRNELAGVLLAAETDISMAELCNALEIVGCAGTKTKDAVLV